MKYDLVIFDLDGTLLNTLDDLADAANAALREFGFSTRSKDEIRTFIGGGVARLIRCAVPEGTGDDTIGDVLGRFKAIYTENVDVKTEAYPGIVEMLTTLKCHGVKCAVNSNKVDVATQLLCGHHFGALIDLALGERPEIPKKPAADGARYIMETLGSAPGKTLYVGDGDADLLTAQNAGIDCAWVSWGYRRRDELEGIDIPRAFDDVPALMRFIL